MCYHVRKVENLRCSDVLSECSGVRSVDVGSLIKMNTKHQRFGGRSNMMDITKRKKRMAVSFIMVLVMAITMLVASSVNTFAVSDTGFSFRIPPYQGNGYEKHGRHRGNVPTWNRWWVRLDHSGEGKGSATDFWLEGQDGRNVSPYMRVRCGKGWFAQNAYEIARSRTVFLTAEDNRNKSSGYNVSGRWQQQD